jgi:hypothetical protein
MIANNKVKGFREKAVVPNWTLYTAFGWRTEENDDTSKPE